MFGTRSNKGKHRCVSATPNQTSPQYTSRAVRSSYSSPIITRNQLLMFVAHRIDARAIPFTHARNIAKRRSTNAQCLKKKKRPPRVPLGRDTLLTINVPACWPPELKKNRSRNHYPPVNTTRESPCGQRAFEFGGGNVPFPFGVSSQKVLNALRRIRHSVQLRRR